MAVTPAIHRTRRVLAFKPERTYWLEAFETTEDKLFISTSPGRLGEQHHAPHPTTQEFKHEHNTLHTHLPVGFSLQ